MTRRRNRILPLLLAFAAALWAASSWVLPQLRSRPADEWIQRLERPERVRNLRIEEVIHHLQLQPGQVVADLGAGTGVFARAFAKAVAPGGKVYAVDIDQGLIDYIDKRAAEENLDNLQGVLGEFDDPKLPAADVDLAFFHDVLHHIEHRQLYLKNLSKYLKPDARVAIIDMYFDRPDSPHHDDEEVKITQEEVKAWMKEVGFEATGSVDLYDDKWFLIFTRIQ